MTHDVFISYASKDKPIADAVCARLEQASLRCWVAPRDILPGEEYTVAIVNAIENSSILILVLSGSANVSPHISREAERAVHRGVSILPLRVEDILPSGSLEYLIGATHWLDAVTPPIDRHLDRLVQAAQLLVRRNAASRTVDEHDHFRRVVRREVWSGTVQGTNGAA